MAESRLSMNQSEALHRKDSNSFYLVTTSDLRTWELSQPVVFLDNDCLIRENEMFSKKMEYLVFENTSNFFEDKINLKNDVDKKISEIFNELVSILNNQHNASFSPNFWRIIIGHWLEVYVGTLLERENKIKSLLKSKMITGAKFIKIEDASLIPKDYNSTIENFKIAAWQSTLDLKIILNLPEIDFRFNVIEETFPKLTYKEKPAQHLSRPDFLILLKKLYNKASIFLTRKNEAYINSTYLPRSQEMLLELSYFQLPKFWRNYLQYDETATPNLDLRKSLCGKLQNKVNSDLIINELFNLMPVCYLEGFSTLYHKAQKSKLPMEPKFIFTSNDFASFELFKMYMAIHKENGTQCIVGQHGSQYGTNQLTSPMLEEQSCSKFITWGWESSDRKYVPGFVFSIAGRKLRRNPKGGLLLVLFPLGIGKHDFAVTHLPDLYLNDQKKFIGMLNDDLTQKLTLRFHSGTTHGIENDIDKFKEINSKLLVEKNVISIEKLISANRLCVFSYDSTGLLENLAMNIPTLAFWQFGLKHLNEQARSYYQLLVDVGIIHLTPESAAKKVNHVWDHVDEWWQSPNVQIAREQFCHHYARTPENPVRNLRNIIKSD